MCHVRGMALVEDYAMIPELLNAIDDDKTELGKFEDCNLYSIRRPRAHRVWRPFSGDNGKLKGYLVG